MEPIPGKGIDKRTDTVILNHSFAIQKSGNRFHDPSVRNIGFKLIGDLESPILVRIDMNSVATEVTSRSRRYRVIYDLGYPDVRYGVGRPLPLWPGCALVFFLVGFLLLNVFGAFPGWSLDGGTE